MGSPRKQDNVGGEGVGAGTHPQNKYKLDAGIQGNVDREAGEGEGKGH